MSQLKSAIKALVYQLYKARSIQICCELNLHSGYTSFQPSCERIPCKHDQISMTTEILHVRMNPKPKHVVESLRLKVRNSFPKLLFATNLQF